LNDPLNWVGGGVEGDPELLGEVVEVEEVVPKGKEGIFHGAIPSSPLLKKSFQSPLSFSFGVSFL